MSHKTRGPARPIRSNKVDSDLVAYSPLGYPHLIHLPWTPSSPSLHPSLRKSRPRLPPLPTSTPADPVVGTVRGPAPAAPSHECACVGGYSRSRPHRLTWT